MSQSSPTGDQAETEGGFIAGNDAGNRVVANLLRVDSAGRADSASAALGDFACFGQPDGAVREISQAA